MKIDWNKVKKQTLWNYEDLIAKLQNVLDYNLTQEHYNHTFKQAQSYAKKIRGGYLQNRGDKTDYIDNMIANFRKLDTLHIGTYSKLIDQVATREQCIAFLNQTNFDFDQLILTLNFIMRWVLPFKTPIREFIDVKQTTENKYLDSLKLQKIGSNLDLLEIGSTKGGRNKLSGITGIPLPFITALVHKTDISRLAYVRGKTVGHLCGGGFDTLDKLSKANLAEMEIKMEAYYKSIGKSSSDFKAVIPVSWMVGGAKILPRIVKI
jgi:hypothetical protein